jgi:hypothetical protein
MFQAAKRKVEDERFLEITQISESAERRRFILSATADYLFTHPLLETTAEDFYEAGKIYDFILECPDGERILNTILVNLRIVQGKKREAMDLNPEENHDRRLFEQLTQFATQEAVDRLKN